MIVQLLMVLALVAQPDPALLERAEQGGAAAQFEASSVFLDGGQEREAFKWMLRAAEGGHEAAEVSVGMMFEHGTGVPVDREQASTWYAKAIERKTKHSDVAQARIVGLISATGGKSIFPGDDWSEELKGLWKKAYYEMDDAARLVLGYKLYVGEGVERDPETAVLWWKKAAANGDIAAQYNLGVAYASGTGVERNGHEANRRWEIAAAAGHEGAVERVRIRLFDVLLLDADRDSMRAALKQRGVPALREDGDFWFDKYSAEGVLDGTDLLSLGYRMKDGRFGVAEYRFPSSQDQEQIVEIARMVTSKYGPPDDDGKRRLMGDVSYSWNRGGVLIKVSRGWPDTTTFLTYVLADVKMDMDEEAAALERSRKEEQQKKQSDAF